MSKIAKRYKRYRSNPSSDRSAATPLVSEVLEFVGPGFGAFVATRFATRVASSLIAKRWPKAAKHAGAIASSGALASAWLLADKWKPLRNYHLPIIVGSAIAWAQSIIQLYFPKIGWLVSDASPTIQKQIASGNQVPQQQRIAQPIDDQPYDDGYADLDDGAWYSYNDARQAGRYAPNPPQDKQAEPDLNATDTNDYDLDEVDNLMNGDDLQAAGIFG